MTKHVKIDDKEGNFTIKIILLIALKISFL